MINADKLFGLAQARRLGARDDAEAVELHSKMGEIDTPRPEDQQELDVSQLFGAAQLEKVSEEEADPAELHSKIGGGGELVG